MEELQNLRKIIDVLDDEIISLISERQSISDRIGKLKHEMGLDVFNHSREEFLKQYHSELSEKYGVSENFVLELFDLIITESRRIQKI